MCGGVTLAGDHLFVPLRREVARRAFKPAVQACRIVPGELAGTAGVYGAAGPFWIRRAPVPKVGIVGSLVWDLIYGRDRLAPPTRGVGRDRLRARRPRREPAARLGDRPAHQGGARSGAPGRGASPRARATAHPAGAASRCPAPNNRVVLHYKSSERRCERMSGGVPGWTWPELGPMVRDLDAIYLNFISGFELCLGTAQALAAGIPGPIYADLHSLFLGMQHDGMRVLQPLPDAPPGSAASTWSSSTRTRCASSSPDPSTLSAQALGAGMSTAGGDAGPQGRGLRRGPGVRWLATVSAASQSARSGRGCRLAALPPYRHPHRADPRASASRPSIPRLRRRLRRRRLCPAASRATGSRPRCGTPRRWPRRNAALRGAGGLARAPPRRAARSVTRIIEVPAHLRRPLVRAVRRRVRRVAAGGEAAVRRARRPVGLALRPASACSPPARRWRRPERERPLFTVPTSDGGQALLGAGRVLPPRRRAVRAARQGAQATATGPSDVLLDVTPVRATEDVHEVVERISEGAVAHSPRRAGPREQGDLPIQYGAFGGMPEYCGARRHGRLGCRAGVYLSAPARPPRGGHRGERRRHRLPAFAREHPRKAVRRALGRRRRARSGADPGRQPFPRPRPRARAFA